MRREIRFGTVLASTAHVIPLLLLSFPSLVNTSQLPIIGEHFVHQSDIEENNPFLKHLYSKGRRASKKLSEGAAMQGQDDLEEEMETE
jgi:hypothetical protein